MTNQSQDSLTRFMTLRPWIKKRIMRFAFVVLSLVGASSCQSPRDTTVWGMPVYQVDETRVLLSDVYTERVASLSDGRIALVDPYKHRLVLIDPASGQYQSFGRKGRGPGEFNFPHPLLLLQADTLAVPEVVGRKLHIFAPTGEYLRTEIIPRGLPAGGWWVSSQLFSDGLGFIYVATPRLNGPLVRGHTDTVPIMRFVLGQQAMDSVWSTETTPIHDFPTAAGLGHMPMPLGDRNVVGVSRSGDIWEVLGASQRVRFHTAAGESQGTPWGLSIRAPTKAEQDSVQQELGRLAPYRGLRLTFPDRAGLFSEGTIAPVGEAWLRLLNAPQDSTSYLIIDDRGNPSGTVNFPGVVTVVGFGSHEVYVLQEDEYGVTNLMAVRVVR